MGKQESIKLNKSQKVDQLLLYYKERCELLEKNNILQIKKFEKEVQYYKDKC